MTLTPPARPADEENLMSTATVTMYSTTWCGYCSRLKQQLGREGIDIVEIDIEQDPAAAERVEQLNGGNRTVPTVVFPDGTAATNPSLKEVKQRLGV
jgi:mycoredoxin